MTVVNNNTKSTNKKVAPGPSQQQNQTSPEGVEEGNNKDADLESGFPRVTAVLSSNADPENSRESNNQTQYSSYSYLSNLGT